MDIFFLGANKPIAKTFYRAEHGEIEKTSYPHIRDFTSYNENISNITDFFTHLQQHSQKGHCLAKGILDRPLINESRAKAARPEVPTQWLCLDIDGPHLHINKEKPLSTQVLASFDPTLAQVSHIVQYSSSHGIPHEDDTPESGTKISLHIFILLTNPTSPDSLKRWLKHLNFRNPWLRANLILTRSKNALHYPLDISTCENGKLIYIADPIIDSGIPVVDHGPRLVLVRGEYDSYTFDHADLNYNIEEEQFLIFNQLREQAGLPPRKITLKTIAGLQVDVNPTPCAMTGWKQRGDWCYLNLNGGDSWGYYHHVTNPEYLYNFKGEPQYPIRVLLPDYYPRAVENAARLNGVVLSDPPSEILPFRFIGRDRKLSRYFEATYFEATKTLNFNYVRDRKMISDFLGLNGMVAVEHIPIWDIEYKPRNMTVVDFARNSINTWQNSPYYLRDKPEIPPEPEQFPLIAQIISHALGDCETTYERFIHWLADIYQYGEKTGVAWVLHGTTGTGKGVIFGKIISEIFHKSNCQMMTPTQFIEDNFNSWVATKQFIAVDEMDAQHTRNIHKFIAMFKHLTTEQTTTVRKMYAEGVSQSSYINILLFSNKPNAAQIDPEDRRISVAPKQVASLESVYPGISTRISQGDIEKELPVFADYLATFPVNKMLSRKPLENATKADMRAVTQDPLSELIQNILNGNLDYFISTLPERPERHVAYIEYAAWVKDTVEHLLNGKQLPVTRDNMKSIMAYIIGENKMGAGALSKLLAKNGLTLRSLRYKEITTTGYPAKWRTDTLHDELAMRIKLL